MYRDDAKPSSWSLQLPSQSIWSLSFTCISSLMMLFWSLRCSLSCLPFYLCCFTIFVFEVLLCFRIVQKHWQWNLLSFWVTFSFRLGPSPFILICCCSFSFLIVIILAVVNLHHHHISYFSLMLNRKSIWQDPMYIEILWANCSWFPSHTI